MRKLYILLLLSIFATFAATKVYAINISSVFGTGVTSCVFSFSAPTITTGGIEVQGSGCASGATDCAMLTLLVNGAAYPGTVSIQDTGTGFTAGGKSIPAGGAVITSSKPGKWNLQISAPPQLTSICGFAPLQAYSLQPIPSTPVPTAVPTPQ